MLVRLMQGINEEGRERDDNDNDNDPDHEGKVRITRTIRDNVPRWDCGGGDEWR